MNMLELGESCWRVDRADKLSVIIDGQEYFIAAKKAMLAAQRSIFIIGWDMDTRIELEPGEQTLEGPNTLGDFLTWLPATREDLRIHVLKWDLGMLQSLGRGMMPMAVKSAMAPENLLFRLDTAHPSGAAHHSKILVIDDQIAFCGGIDMMVNRWDTRDHLDQDPKRVLPNGEPAMPWHDATTCISGEVAWSLGELARERWYRATGERLEIEGQGAHADELWPDLEPIFEGIDVGIARTFPDYEGYPEVREIEALYLRAIKEVREVLYIETQYLASARIARALAKRLAEENGPEIVVVLPRDADGWLEKKAMDGARQRLLKFLWASDKHDRFRAFYPVTEEGEAIYVHAKVMTVDDRLLRVGSSNLNNRSMGFDTECDLAVEAREGPESRERDVIAGIRNDLVAEHLRVQASGLVNELHRNGGSLVRAISALKGEGKTLIEFTRPKVEEDDSLLAENEFADPESVENGLGERLGEGVVDLVRGLYEQG